MQRHIAIAGCGISGLAAASLLARADGPGACRVTVFDRLERPAPMGSGLILQPVGLAALDAIGVGQRIRDLGAPIERLFGRVRPSNSVVLDVSYARLGKGVSGLAVHRGALFQALYDQALAAGVEIGSGQEIAGASDGRLELANGNTSAKFDLVIDALGVRSPLSRSTPLAPLPFGALWANLDWPQGSHPFQPNALEQRYEAARKMVGVLPIGRLDPSAPRQLAFFWSLRHADLARWRAQDLGEWKSEVKRLWPETEILLGQITSRDQLIFAAYAHGTLASPLTRDLVHIGDSWHCASPQLGQGANMALLDAFALATALRAHDDIADALSAYAHARLGHIRLYQLASWVFTPAYQSDSDLIAWVRDWVMSPVSRIWPAPKLLAALVAGHIGAPLSAIGAIADG